MSMTTEWLMDQHDHDLDLLAAEIDHLRIVNGEMLRALMRSENWLAELARVFPGEVPPDVLEQVRAAITAGRESST